MWRALAWSHHFTKREVWVHKRSLTRLIVLKCLWRDRKVRGHVCVCYVYRFCFFLRFVIGIGSCSDSVVFLIFHFIVETHCISLTHHSLFWLNSPCQFVNCRQLYMIVKKPNG
jgi:hypothetical protein